jgi:hypothetical protein
MAKEINVVSRERVERYEGVIIVFNALFHEVKELGKKKPDATLSKTKVHHINRVLDDVKFVIDGEPESKYCELLETETMPQFGDAILIMAQFDGALKAFRSRHYGTAYGSIHSDWYYEDIFGEDEDENEDEDSASAEDEEDDGEDGEGEGEDGEGEGDEEEENDDNDDR